MRIGIDASNIRQGGGVTHLVEMLKNAAPRHYGFEKVIVWGGDMLLSQLPNLFWLEKQSIGYYDKNAFFRAFWQRFIFPKLAKSACDVLFIPGGNYTGKFKPYVTMFQNMLLFDSKETYRYFPRRRFFRLNLLRFLQSRAFKNANAVICLSEHARKVLNQHLKQKPVLMEIIPHGICEKFFFESRIQRSIACYDDEHPFRILYVSTIDEYKHQWRVVKAVAKLKKLGLPVVLDLIGSAYSPSLKRLKKIIYQADPDYHFIHYLGALSYDELPHYYVRADLFIFASSCENFPNILLEAMASSLPIACSKYSPMPDILQDAGVYFDPENESELADSLCKLIYNIDLRKNLARQAYQYALNFSWKKCADATFNLLERMV